MDLDEERRVRQESTVPVFPEVTTPLYKGSDYSFTLQAVMEMQKAVGQLTEAVKTLSEHSKDQAKKLDRISHIIYAAGAVLAIGIVIGGFLLTTLKELLINYFNSNPLPR